MDGQTIYQPANPAPDNGQKVLLKRVILLTDQNTVAQATSVDALSSYTKQVETVVVASVPVDAQSFELLLTVTLTPSVPVDIQLQTQGGANDNILQAIHDGVNALSALEVNQKISFQIHFLIR